MRVNQFYPAVIIMSLLTLLSTSSFFLSDYLTQRINDNNYTDGLLSYALKNNNIAALMAHEAKTEVGSEDWLALNRRLANTKAESALKLGYWHQRLANKHADATMTSVAILWFEQAIRLDSQQAVLALAKLYFQQGSLPETQQTLLNYANAKVTTEQKLAVLILRVKIAIHLGDIALVKRLVTLLPTSTISTDVAELLNHIDTFAILPDEGEIERINNVSNRISRQSVNGSRCISSLQLFATNLKHLKHLEQLINTFNLEQPLAAYICLPIPRYISAKQLDCNFEAAHAIVCDEARWKVIADKVDSRHVGLMLKSGGANVHLGILYFDIEDNQSVFSHEVSHLLGFVDEYPLVKNHDKCQAPQQRVFSHNIAVLNKLYYGERQAIRAQVLADISWSSHIKDSTPILQRLQNNSSNTMSWKLGTPNKFKDNIGVYLTETCQYSSKLQGATNTIKFSAFKPVNKRTRLRNLSSPFPEQYISLLNTKPSAYLMPSFHYNIALALYQQGEVTQSIDWLERAAQWEDLAIRKELIGKGGF